MIFCQMVSKEALIGSWKSYKVDWGEDTMIQGRANYTLFRFLKDGTLFTEIMMDNKGFYDDNESQWDLQEQEEKTFIVVNNDPLYEIVELKDGALVLKSYSGISWYFIHESKWSSQCIAEDDLNAKP